MTNVMGWVNEHLLQFGFGKIRGLPALGEIKAWRGEFVEDGIIQIFFSSNNNLNLYMHDIKNKKTDVIYLSSVTEEAYAEELFVGEEDVQKIMRESKKEALQDEKHLKEVSNIENFLKTQKEKKELQDSDISILADWYGREIVIKPYDGEILKIEGVVVGQNDLVLANDDFTGFAIERKSGTHSLIGEVSKFFSIKEKKESNWVFFTLNMNLMNFLSETTYSRVVFVEDINNIDGFLQNKSVGMKFCLLVDHEHVAYACEGFDKIIPPENSKNWVDFLTKTQDVEIVRSHLREQLKPQK